MPQPYDYSLNVPNPVEAVLQGVMMRRQMDAEQAKVQRQRQMQNDLQSLQTDPSPQSYANFYLRYPEMKEQVDAYRSTLADADKNVMLGASRELMGALQAGRDDLVTQVFDKHIAALKESSRPDLAKQFEDAKAFYAADPKAGAFAVRSMFQNLDPDGYKALMDNGDNKIASSIAELAPFVGEDAAKRLVLAQQAAKGIVSASGPAGTTFQRADEVFMLPAAEQPKAAAHFVAGSDEAEPMTVGQFTAAADALGIGKAVNMIERNGIRIKVASPQEADKLPSGTKIILPDGSEGVVP